MGANWIALTAATIFKLGSVGLAGDTSEEELALASIIAAPDAHKALKALLRDSKSNEAKLYALCGLRNVSRAAFLGEVAHVRWDGATFNHMRADVIAKAPIQPQLDRMRVAGCAIDKPPK